MRRFISADSVAPNAQLERQMDNRSRLIFALALTFLTLSGCRLYYGVWHGDFSGQSLLSNAQKAEQLASAGNYPEAISAYEKHIASRIADTRKDPSENPYFYELYIGDLYLQLDDPKSALEHYEVANRHDVENKLITDRIVRLSRYFVSTGKQDEAVKTLHRFRDIDPDAIDAEIDETHKKMIAVEDSAPRRSQAMKSY